MTPSASPFPVRPLKASAIEHVTPPRLGDAVSSGAFVAPQARIMRQGSEAGEGVPANGAGTIARKGALIKHGDEARVPRGKRFVGVMDRVAEEEVEIGLAEPVSPDVPTAPTKASREETYKNFCASLIIGFKGYATKKRLSFQVSAFLENDIFPSIACSSDELSARLNEFYMDSGFEARADLVRSLQKSTTMIMNYLETIRVMKDGQDCTDIIKKNCIKMSNIFEER